MIDQTKLNILKNVSDILGVLKEMEEECKTEKEKKALEDFKKLFFKIGDTVKDVD